MMKKVSELEPGTKFAHDLKYMKIKLPAHETDNIPYNSVNIDTGELCYINPETLVIENSAEIKTTIKTSK